MDIDLLSKMVKELILEKDKVALPGLGSFIAEVVPSTFSDKGYTINPPYRRLSFRPRLSEGDELISLYALSNNVDKVVAERIVAEFLAELKSVLFVKKTVLFPGLGRMRATKENTIFFVADEDLDIYPEGYALEPVSLKAHVFSDSAVSEAIIEIKTYVETEPVTESVTEPVTEPVVEPIEKAVVEPTDEQKDLPAEVVEEAPRRKRSFGKVVFIVLISLVVLALLLFAAFMVVTRMCPEFLDPILYSAEELEILNYKL